MIKNYQEYTDQLKAFSAETKIYRKKIAEIVIKQLEIEKKLVKEAHSHVIEQLSQKLKKVTLTTHTSKIYKNDADYFLLNDEIGIYVYPCPDYSTLIHLRVAYIKNSKPKLSDKKFEWEYKSGGITIDRFIDDVIEGLERIYKYRKEAEMKRTAKKYNL